MNNDDKVRKAIGNLGTQILDLNMVEETIALLKETLPPEQRLYFNQPVLVSDNMEPRNERYFSHMKGDLFMCFSTGHSSRATNATTPWKYCKPDPKAESLINWIDHSGGECPVDPETQVTVIYKDGRTAGVRAHNRIWSDVVKYAVIPLPKY